MEDFFRQNLALLKGNEAKVLLAWLMDPMASRAQLMRLSGVTDRVSFWRAIKGLKKWGVLQKPTHDVAEPDLMLQKPTYFVAEPDPVVAKPDSREMQQVAEPDLDLEDALIQADEMDDSGDFRSHSSPFSLRRKQQIELLQQAWGDLFGETISALAVKELLQLAFSESIDVYHVMVQASDRKVQYPKAYIKKTLQEIAKKPQNRPPARTAEEGLLPVTDEMRQSWAENEKLVAGYMSGWEV